MSLSVYPRRMAVPFGHPLGPGKQFLAEDFLHHRLRTAAAIGPGAEAIRTAVPLTIRASVGAEYTKKLDPPNLTKSAASQSITRNRLVNRLNPH